MTILDDMTGADFAARESSLRTVVGGEKPLTTWEGLGHRDLLHGTYQRERRGMIAALEHLRDHPPIDVDVENWRRGIQVVIDETDAPETPAETDTEPS